MLLWQSRVSEECLNLWGKKTNNICMHIDTYSSRIHVSVGWQQMGITCDSSISILWLQNTFLFVRPLPMHYMYNTIDKIKAYDAWGTEAMESLSLLASRLATSSNRAKAEVLAALYGRLNLNLVRANATAILPRCFVPDY